MKTITITGPGKKLKGDIRLPFSKSISNRLLIIRALSGEDFIIKNLSDADDTKMLQDLLVKIHSAGNTGKLMEINAGDAGTVMRFLIAYLAMFPGKWVLTGTQRMKQRPVGILVDGLKDLGADIEYLAKLGFPPVLIKGKTLHGKEIVVDPEISSQFVSALIMIGPLLPEGLRMHIAGHPVSQPYVEMTIKLLNEFGVSVRKERSFLVIPHQEYKTHDYTVEADWSAAAFWYEAAALSEEADLFLYGLKKDSLQGDSVTADIFENLGVHSEFSVEGVRLTKKGLNISSFAFNFIDFPDIAPAVITTCAALGLKGEFEGLASLRIKESDRLSGLRNEFEKAGISLLPAEESAPVLCFDSSDLRKLNTPSFSSYGDHRMAMTFAPLSLITGNLTIDDPDVVAKSYPSFWEDMSALGFRII